MMLCTIDLETSGFNFENDHITEIAWTIKEHGQPRSVVDKRHYVKGVKEIPADVVALTGVTVEHCDTYGVDLEFIHDDLLHDLRETGARYFAAHNGNRFDKLFLYTQLARLEKFDEREFPPWLDTLTDIKWPDSFRCLQLGHLCAEFGFVNPFPHNGLSDVWATAKLLDLFPIDDVIARATTPTVAVYADVSYDDRELAKSAGFRWENWQGRKFAKSWVKCMKECDYFADEYNFKTKVIEKWA